MAAQPSASASAPLPPLRILYTPSGMLTQYNRLTEALGPARLAAVQKILTIVHIQRIATREIRHTLNLWRIVITASGTSLFCAARYSKYLALLTKWNVAYHLETQLSPGRSITNSMLPGISLKPEQQAIVDYLLTHFYNADAAAAGKASAIINAPTGAGKTFLAGFISAHIGGKTLVVLPGKSTFKEWQDMIKGSFPHLAVGEYHSKIKSDGDFVITTFSSVITDEFRFREAKLSSVDYLKTFRTVIIDEIQNTPTQRRAEMFWRLNMPYKIGLSATPNEREDGMDVVYPAHFGPVVNVLNIPGFRMESTVWNGKIIRVDYKGPAEFTVKLTNPSTGWVDAGQMYRQFERDPWRNALIIQWTKKLYDEGDNVYIYTRHRDRIDIIIKLLIWAGFSADNQAIGMLRGGVTVEERASLANSRIIVATYDYATEGVSLGHMVSEIFDTPRKKRTLQLMGRTTRTGADQARLRRYIDIVDVNTSIKSQYSARKKAYQIKGYPIERQTITWSELTPVPTDLLATKPADQ